MLNTIFLVFGFVGWFTICVVIAIVLFAIIHRIANKRIERQSNYYSGKIYTKKPVKMSRAQERAYAKKEEIQREDDLVVRQYREVYVNYDRFSIFTLLPFFCT